MDIVATLDAVISEINKIPCDDLALNGVSCLKMQRHQAGRAITPFQEYNLNKMCNSCAAYWHASRAMSLMVLVVNNG